MTLAGELRVHLDVIEKWGVGFSPHGALAPRSAGPTRLLRPRHQSSLHRIPLDVMLDAIELVAVAHDPVEVFVLPELLAALRPRMRLAKAGSCPLNPSNELSQRTGWCSTSGAHGWA
jgi:hypothetical protein